MGRARQTYLRGPTLDLSRSPSLTGQHENMSELRRRLLLAAQSCQTGRASLYVDIDGTTRIARGAPDDPLTDAMRVGVYTDDDARPATDELREAIIHHLAQIRAQ